MPPPLFIDDLVTLRLGDCLDVMAAMPDGSVDAVVCDPPYGLGFMGKEWDSGKAFVERKADKRNTFDHVGGNHNPVDSADAARTRRVEGQKYGAWCERWAAECLRVLKPGGHLLAFGGTRTYHRLACAIEDAGFEIRDSLHWVYGSGFPKSLNVERAIAVITCTLPGRHFASRLPKEDERLPGDHVCPVTPESGPWDGFGTAAKPAHEPIVIARKPLAGTVAGNVLEWGTGALNVDGCRVEGPAGNGHWIRNGEMGTRGIYGQGGQAGKDFGSENPAGGRWPPNILLTHSADCNGTCAPGCPVAGLDAQSGTLVSSLRGKNYDTAATNQVYGDLIRSRANPGNTHGDSGGASRFFPVLNWDAEADLPFLYCAKAPKSERPRLADGAAWPTVKPLALMRWLVRLVTPPGGLVLDPFAGTGTTGEAATLEGFPSLLIERDPVAAELALQRLRKPSRPTLFNMAGA